MSPKFDQSAVSSLSSITSSINNDNQVYRWFLMFISIPEIQQGLCIKDKTKKAYTTLKKIQIYTIISYLVLTLIITLSMLMNNPWILFVEVIPLTALVYIPSKNRNCVAAISEDFLVINIKPDELNNQTLYQTSEYLSQKYNTPSMVDIITNQDFIGRKVLLGTALIIPFIYHFKTWQLLAAILVVFSAATAIVNTSIVLRKLK